MVRKRLQVVIICIYEITSQVSCQDQVTNQDEVMNTTFDPNMIPALLWFYDGIKWKHFPRYLPFVWGIQRSPVNPITKAMTRRFDVFLICAWTNSRGNTGDTGDLRRLRAHYDVMVMSLALRLSHLPESNSEVYGKIKPHKQPRLTNTTMQQTNNPTMHHFVTEYAHMHISVTKHSIVEYGTTQN